MSLRKSHTTRKDYVADSYDRYDISTAPDPPGPGHVDILTHSFTTAACAAGAVTATAGVDNSRCRDHGNWRTRQLALDCEYK